MSNSIADLFDPASVKFQFAPDSVFTPHFKDAGGIVYVTDLTSALTALQTIVNQGEGNPRPFDGPAKDEKDHYDIYLDLQQGPRTWDVYPVVTDPTTAKYFDLDKKVYAVRLIINADALDGRFPDQVSKVSRTVDAAFCYLLLTLEKLWDVSSVDGRGSLVGSNMFPLMTGILAPLAGFLIQQPVGSAGEVAGPCFGYYPFASGAGALNDLKQEIQAAIDAYAGNSGAQGQLQSIQQSISGLVDVTAVS